MGNKFLKRKHFVRTESDENTYIVVVNDQSISKRSIHIG